MGFRWARQQGLGTLWRKGWRGNWGLQRVKGSQLAARGQREPLKDGTTRLTCAWESQA